MRFRSRSAPAPQLELEPVKQTVRAAVEARWTMSPPTGF
jgi:uncharacterized protein